MKNIILSLLVVIVIQAKSQKTVYFESTDSKLIGLLSQEFQDLGYKESQNKENADFIISVNTLKVQKVSFHAVITLFDKEGNRLYITKKIKGSATAFNGYQTLSDFVKKLKKKELLNMIAKMK